MGDRLRHWLPGLIGLVLVAAVGLPLLSAGPSQAERDQLARRYRFASKPLSPEHWSGTPLRAVQPSLKLVSAWISAIGSGVSLYDVDGDGLPNDVCLVDARFDSVSLAPAPGTGRRYSRQTLKPTGLAYDTKTTDAISCAAGDLNEDGHTDLLVDYFGRSPILFLRRPDVMLGNPKAFVAQDLLSPAQIWNSTAVNVADLDGDGHNDVVVGNFFPKGARLLGSEPHDPKVMNDSFSHAVNSGRDRFLLWQHATGGAHPSVTFREVDNVLSHDVGGGWTFAAGTQDLDGDGLPELYFANDFGRDRLLVNRSTPGKLRFILAEGHRRFSDPKSKVLGHDSFKGMGVDFPDLNGDGRPDIVVSNITSDYAFHESNGVFVSAGKTQELNRGVAPYEDASEPLGLSRSGWGWDIKAGDFDNDGQPELMQAVGFVRGPTNKWPQLQEFTLANDPILKDARLWPDLGAGTDLSGHERNAFFAREGKDGKFINVNDELGLPQPGVSRGLALADIDHDGRLDFAVANQWAPSYLMRNTARSAGRFLGLHLSVPATTGDGAMPAIGASIRVIRADGQRLVSQVYPASGHGSVSAPESMFGLGASAAPVDVQIRWRDTAGRLHTATRSLRPGWHRLLLTPRGEIEEVIG